MKGRGDVSRRASGLAQWPRDGMDREQYDRDGYAIVRGVFRPEEVAELRSAARSLWAEGRRHGRSFRHGNVVFRIDRDAALGPSLRFVQ